MSNTINNSKQYEAMQLNKENKKELLRALFESYKNRINTGIGFSSMETVMNDRLMSFKNITKKEIENRFYTAFFLIFIGYLIYINIASLSINFFLLLAGINGFLFSMITIFLLKNISPLRTNTEKIAFKKVMYDVYFETITSAHLIYYVFLFILSILLIIFIFFTEPQLFYKIDLIILKLSYKLNIVPFLFSTLLKNLLIAFIAYILGSFLYLYIFIFRDIKKIIKKGNDDNW